MTGLLRHEQRLVMKVFTAWRGQSYGTVVQSAARRRWEERGRAVAMRGGGGAGLEHLAFASGAGADSRASYDSRSVGSVSAGRRSGLDVDQSPSKVRCCLVVVGRGCAADTEWSAVGCSSLPYVPHPAPAATLCLCAPTAVPATFR